MFDKNIAYITCSCGKIFQVINKEGTDWDEQATAQIYYSHLENECPDQKK
ncbi:MAG: hypothetical protein N2169_07920 [bacterium]|nr:hypothetical protein [bacterium]